MAYVNRYQLLRRCGWQHPPSIFFDIYLGVWRAILYKEALISESENFDNTVVILTDAAPLLAIFVGESGWVHCHYGMIEDRSFLNFCGQLQPDLSGSGHCGLNRKRAGSIESTQWNRSVPHTGKRR